MHGSKHLPISELKRAVKWVTHFSVFITSVPCSSYLNEYGYLQVWMKRGEEYSKDVPISERVDTTWIERGRRLCWSWPIQGLKSLVGCSKQLYRPGYLLLIYFPAHAFFDAIWTFNKLSCPQRSFAAMHSFLGSNQLFLPPILQSTRLLLLFVY